MKNLIIEKLFFNSAHLGCLNSIKNSSCSLFVHSSVNKYSIINLEKTCFSILKALKFLKSLCSTNKDILFVATSDMSSALVSNYCKKNGIPFVGDR
jgi:ribosomal protein S2